ncbi:DUF3307 domain-containing protein [Maritalea mobilis]|uniref:DUF3307 domain-containing protein n=1 Tax=Maritalea mobilis TaxID=483324 RepID=UPI001C951F33|nr:DUF3307 domain-containing protein [Maritalea mobilis]MBY6200033.1 DUF3307 domain-containing protein [Maritalea mobilis]
MATQTFAALFLAHVIADYLAQTTWLVENKRRPLALGTHITLVFLAMLLTTWTFSPWFLALTGAHLLIDLLKTFGLPKGLPAYIADQVLHLTSIVGVTLLAPGLWAESPLSNTSTLPIIYLVLAGIIFAARGGQYAVLTLVARKAPPSHEGILLGWMERAAFCVVLLMGLPVLVLPVIGIKLIYAWRSWAERNSEARRRLVLGTLVSFAWGLGTAIPLAMFAPTLLAG